tara:strand:- start:1159 stop:1686 length:528 start_codon:yes stop_codon:yes gene_type:complete
MAILTTLSNFDISNNIVDSNENIIVWYNGTKIKYYHRYEQVTTEVETISGVISIKILSDTNVKITTASKVRELILTRPATTNTYTLTLDNNYSTANDPQSTWTLSLTDYGNLTGNMSSTVANTATAVASAINNLTNFTASANSNVITYTNSASQIVATSSINFTLSRASGGGQFN